jgi:hypothetical protein
LTRRGAYEIVPRGMRRLRLQLVVITCAIAAVLTAGPASAKVACLSASDVAKATGFAASSVQPMNVGLKIICLYNGAGGTINVTYAVGQPMNTFTMSEKATSGAKVIKGIGNGAYATTAGTQTSLYAIVTGKSEFVINAPVSLTKAEALARKIAASLH